MALHDMFGAWWSRPEDLPAMFASAKPFPLVVIEEFLTPELAEALVAEFPAIDAMPKSRDYVFGNKHELSSLERSPAGATYRDAVLSPEFADMLSRICGATVFVDPDFHGGGFHQGGDGSYLDFHVDFNLHPAHANWLRTLNVLLYLNPGWQPEYGGDLLIKSSPDGPVRALAPGYNQAVIMETSARTFHGYERMTLPPGVTRKSVATYAYQLVQPGAVRGRTTGWHPEHAGAGKRLLARNYDALVKVKNRLFGSGTARNR